MNIQVLHKEIDLVQDVINRMARNSFLVKGWSVTIFSGAFLLLKDQVFTDKVYFVGPIMILASLAFWYIDGFFLHKEKCYRQLYDKIISNSRPEGFIHYSLDYRPYDMDNGKVSKSMKNKTIWPFYLVPVLLNLAAILFVTIYNNV